MKRLSMALVVLLAVSLFATVSFAKTPQELVAELGADMEHMSAMELEMEMAFGEEFLIIDVRTSDEFAAGRIPGSVHVNFGILFFRAGSYIPDKDAMVIISCQSGARSVIAASILQELGYTNVVNLSGGFRNWMDSGYEVETNQGVFVKN